MEQLVTTKRIKGRP